MTGNEKLEERGSGSVVVIAGASRGIGRALAVELSKTGHTVVAGCRTPEAVEDLNHVLEPYGGMALPLDVTDAGSVEQAAKTVDQRFGTINQLVVCAGATHARDEHPTHSKGPLPHLSDSAMTEVFCTNALGPALVLQRFIPLMDRSATPGVVMCLSSHRGSLELTDGPGSISYAMSKAALNMLVKKLSWWPERGRTTVFAVHPGWVATDLGGPEAPLSAQEASRRLSALLSRADGDLNGRFVDTDGADIPW
ncbi:hypothetical protein ADK86_25055 [Streptomyces sp. NRRL F-5755]|uniref:SDR family oxidoreductase n=1 Tax=Streptomyces sp. NRRL F-5755 TaxID=1519475 RepID=UPI0006AF8C41|nr:SDR family oxidoreductase [Streptomyces sp. NRRL F-5755]KOT90812.1 hypothetical protein ADK86_25055 [Streptomyces sp. NRRL F-5755]